MDLIKTIIYLFLFLLITVISISCIKPQRLLCLCGVSVREESREITELAINESLFKHYGDYWVDCRGFLSCMICDHRYCEMGDCFLQRNKKPRYHITRDKELRFISKFHKPRVKYFCKPVVQLFYEVAILYIYIFLFNLELSSLNI